MIARSFGRVMSNEELAKSTAEEHGITKSRLITTTFSMIPSTLDAVSITTPNKYHKQPTIDAECWEKHVLCEKPLAMNAAECREMCRPRLRTPARFCRLPSR
ncbi:MAG: Gfo/Idh/MocA family oxidoreductase [Fimbriimonadaceae bacterium]